MLEILNTKKKSVGLTLEAGSFMKQKHIPFKHNQVVPSEMDGTLHSLSFYEITT